MMNVFFDLDGTIIDSSDRLYELFKALVPDCTMTKEEYWELKRNKINHETILEKYFPTYSFDEFNKKWLEMIETEKYLLKDKLYDFSQELLRKFSEKGKIYLLTARQSRKNLLIELKRLGIEKYFEDILVTENKKTKSDILKTMKLSKNDILIGDTGKDIQTAKENELLSIAVSWGFMSKDALKTYNPDILFDDIIELRKFLFGGIVV